MSRRSHQRAISRSALQLRVATRIRDSNILEVEDLEASITATAKSSPSNPPPPSDSTIPALDQGTLLEPRSNNHVSVGVRIRGLPERTSEDMQLDVNRSGRSISVPRSYLNSKKYTFDAIFPPDCPSEQVYREMVHPLVQEVLAGFSAAVSTFGPRGSGKTHTLGTGGSSAWEGVIALACAETLAAVKQNSEWSLFGSYAEVEREGAADLLAWHEGVDVAESRVREAAQCMGSNAGGMGSLICRAIATVRDCLDLVHEGNRNRNARGGEAESSEGNVIFRLQLVRPLRSGEEQRWHHVHGEDTNRRNQGMQREGLVVSSLLLIDLAGCERTKGQTPTSRSSGDRGSEFHSRAVASLVDAVSNMGGIRRNQEDTMRSRNRAPLWVRETALTWLLKDALLGRAWWAVIVTVKGAGENLREEDSALLFGERVRRGCLRPVWNLASSWNVVGPKHPADRQPHRAVLLSPNPFLKAAAFHKKMAAGPQKSGDSMQSSGGAASSRVKQKTSAERRNPEVRVGGYQRTLKYTTKRGGAMEREHPDVEFSRYVKRSIAQLGSDETGRPQDSRSYSPEMRKAGGHKTRTEALATHAPWPEEQDTPVRSDSQSNPFVFTVDNTNPTASPASTASPAKSSPQTRRPSPKPIDARRAERKGADNLGRGGPQGAWDREVLQIAADLLDAHGVILAGEGSEEERAVQHAEQHEPTRSFTQLLQAVAERPALLSTLSRLTPASEAGQLTVRHDHDNATRAQSVRQPGTRRRLLAVEEEAAGRGREAAGEGFVLDGEAGEAWLLQKLRGIARSQAQSHARTSANAASSPPAKSPHANTWSPPRQSSSSPSAVRASEEPGRNGLWTDLKEMEWARRGDEVREAAGLRAVVQEAEQLARVGGELSEGLQGALMGRREAVSRARGMRGAMVVAAAVCQALLRALHDAKAAAPRESSAEATGRPAVTAAIGQDLGVKPSEDRAPPVLADALSPVVRAKAVSITVQQPKRRQSWPPTAPKVWSPTRKPPPATPQAAKVPPHHQHKEQTRRTKPTKPEVASEVRVEIEEGAAETLAVAKALGVLRAKELVRSSMGMVEGFFGRCRAEMLEKADREAAVKAGRKGGCFGWIRPKKLKR